MTPRRCTFNRRHKDLSGHAAVDKSVINRRSVTEEVRVRVAYGDISSEEDDKLTSPLTSTMRSQCSHHPSALLADC